MSGSTGDGHPPDPSEIFVVGADGNRDPALSAPGSPRPRRAAGHRWAALTITGLLIFGLGVAVGGHIGDGPAGRAATGDESTASLAKTPGSAQRSSIGETSSRPRSSASSPTSTTFDTGPAGPVGPAEPVESSAIEPTNTAAAWPTSPGACNNQVLLPLLAGVESLRTNTGIRLLAGNDTRPFDVDAGTRGPTLFHLHDGEYVSQLGTDNAGTVAVISDCRGFPPVRVVRRSADGHLHAVAAHRSGYQAGSLITGGHRIWLTLYHAQTDAVDYDDDAVLLHATDGTGSVVTLPEGFSPTAGNGELIVGVWSDPQGAAYGPIQLYDLSRHAIVAQLGSTTPQFVVDNGYIVWMPADCSRCPVHRYRIATGASSTVRMHIPPSTSWQAISPDGTRIAGIRYHQHEDPRYITEHPGGPGNFVVLDLDDQSVTPLPGIELAPKSASSLVFSADGRWLAVAVNNGSTGQILLYDHDLNGPIDAGVTVPGPVLWTIPLAVTG